MLKYFAEVAILHLLVSPVFAYFVLSHCLAYLEESEKTRLVNLRHLVIAVAACFLDLGRDFGSYEQSAKMCFAMQASFVVKVLVAAVKYFQEHFLGVGALLAYPIVSHFGFVGHCVLRMYCHHAPPQTHGTVPNQPAQEVRTGAWRKTQVGHQHQNNRNYHD